MKFLLLAALLSLSACTAQEQPVQSKPLTDGETQVQEETTEEPTVHTVNVRPEEGFQRVKIDDTVSFQIPEDFVVETSNWGVMVVYRQPVEDTFASFQK